MSINILGKIKITEFNLPKGIERTLRDAIVSPFQDADALARSLAFTLSTAKGKAGVPQLTTQIKQLGSAFVQVQELAKQLLSNDIKTTQARNQIRSLAKELQSLGLSSQESRRLIFKALSEDIIQASNKNARALEKANTQLQKYVESGKRLELREQQRGIEEFNRKLERQKQLLKSSQEERANTESKRLKDSSSVQRQVDIDLIKSRAAQQKRLEEEESRRIKSQSEPFKQTNREMDRIVKKQDQLNRVIEDTNKLRARGLQLTQLQQSVLTKAEGLTVVDPRSTARANLGLDKTATPITTKQFDDTARALKGVNSELRTLDANTFSVEKFGKATALAFKRYSAFVVGSFGIFRIIGFFRNATDEALKFEKAITKITQVLNTSSQSIRPLSEEIKRLAKETGISATELAEGAFIFAQAGIKQVDQLQLITKELAKIPLSATFDDIKSTSEGLLAVFGQFRLEVSQTAEVLDIINQFAADFAVESKDLFEIVKRGGAAFSVLDGEFQDFIALASVLRETTRETASVVGTFFKTGLSQISRPQSQAELRKLGITVDGVTDQIIELSNILFGPNSKFESRERINIARSVIGDSRQFTRFVSLLRALQDPNIQLRVQQSLQQATGSLDRSIVKQLDDIGTSLNRIKQSFTEFVIAISENEGIKGFIKNIADLTNILSKLSGVVGTVLPLLTPLSLLFLKQPISRFATGFGTLFNKRGNTGITSVLDIPINETNTDRQILINRQRQLSRQRSLRRARGGALVGGLLASELLSRTPDSKTDPTSSRAGKQLLSGAVEGAITGFLIGGPKGALLVGAGNAVIQSFRELSKVTDELRKTELDRILSISKSKSSKFQTILEDITQTEFGKFTNIFKSDASVLNNIKKTILSEVSSGTQSGKIIKDFFKEIIDKASTEVRSSSLTTDIDRQKLFDRLITQELNKFVESIEGIPVLNKIDISTLYDAFRSIVKTISVDLVNAPIDLGDLQVSSNILKDKLNEAFTFIGEAIKQSVRDADLFDMFITNLNESLLLILPSDNTQLLKTFGFENTAKLFSDQNRDFANQLRNFLSNNREILDSFVKKSGEGTEKDFSETNVSEFLKGIFKESLNPDEIQKIIGDVGLILGQLASESGKSLQDIIEDLTGFEGSLVSFVESLRGGTDLIEGTENSISSLIRSQADALNREIQKRRELFDSINSLNSALFEFDNHIREIQNTIDDLITDQQQFITGRTDILGAGRTLLDRSRITQFGGTQQFIQDVLQQSQSRISDITKVLDDRFASSRNFGESSFNIRQSQFSQEEFLNNQRLVSERLSELASRIQNASEASRVFRDAFISLNSNLSSAGQALKQLTVEEITAGTQALQKFVQSTGINAANIGRRGGLIAATQGLNTLTDQEISSIEKLLQSLGDIDLGGGLTGTSLLGEFGRALAAPVIASIRSSLTGESRDDAFESILIQIEEAERLQQEAFNEEIRLREEQRSLIELQKNLAQLEKQFFEDQTVLLQKIADGVTQNENLTAIRSRIEAAFAGNAHNVTIVDTLGKTLDVSPATKSLPNSISSSVRPSLPTNVPLIPGPKGIPIPADTFNPRSPSRSPFDFDPSQVPIDKLRPIDMGPFDQKSPLNSPDLRSGFDTLRVPLEDMAQKFTGSDSNFKNLDKLQDINSKFENLLVSSRNIEGFLSKLSEGFTTKLEVAPMQVNVALGVPDILANVGPELERNIIAAISNKLADTFGDDPEKSSRLRNLA